MNILLVEDMPGFGRHILEQLQSEGHNVTWVVGAQHVDGDYLIGIAPSQEHDEFDSDSWDNEPDRLVTVDFTTVEIALLDGGLIKPVVSGGDFARPLSAFGVPCISITGGGAGAQPMADAGCCAALPKELVLLALRQGVLDFDKLRRAPLAVAQALIDFTESQRSLKFAASKQRSRFFTGFPVLDRLPETN
ncbi:MAG TPA: hypothetical protein V6C81_02520 [Planktothrix sp.]|jgi:hypothetical protein